MGSFRTNLMALALLVVAQSLPEEVQAEDKGFTSAYTDLKTECDAAFPDQAEAMEESGSDMPLRCKGHGGFEIFIGYSAASAHLGVQPVGSEDSIDLGTQPIDYDQNRKIEWRIADGKPFAVIYRIDQSKGEDPTELWQPQNITGQALRVQGLPGFEAINFEVDAKTAGANEKARELADAAYQKAKGK